MEMQELQGQLYLGMGSRRSKLTASQRESSATIKAAPASYEAASPAKPKNIIEIDSRGLEFTDFKADVRGL